MSKEESNRTGLEIAVIGMAGRFPGAKTIDEYWENLKDGVESIIFFSDEELAETGTQPQLLNDPNYVKAKGYLEDVEYFDSVFFGYKPMEAEQMDPQMRVFLQCVWHALEDAGYAPETYEGLIGMYAGASVSSWSFLSGVTGGESASENFVYQQFANKDILCTGISYKLNLKGPSFTLYTACSTSFAALHLGCQGLLSGECDIALAGGVSVTLPAKSGYFYQEGLIQSPDGYCRAFDQDASGTVFGNGAGVVVLKLLEEAIAHRDTIHAMIKGSAMNNDGSRKVGFNAPSTKGQAEVIRATYNAAGINPETIGYIDTHGTGTALGDPIEIEALTIAFDTDKKQFCRIGSVKPNIGHLDAAAGIASFIKTVLVLKHQLIPPSLHCKTPNPKIGFENTPFYVNTQLTPWERDKYPLRAGVSSFGVGGTNVHVVLEEWLEDRGQTVDNGGQMSNGKVEPMSSPYQLILLSAKTRAALDKMTQNLAEHFKKNPHINLADAAYTLQVGREAFPYRQMAVCCDLDDAVAALSNPEAGRVQTFHSPRGNPPVVFMFPGQGAQYVNMGLELYQTEPFFQKQMDRCFEILKSLTHHDIKEILYLHPDSGQGDYRSNRSNESYNTHSSYINQTEIAQPVLFIFEYALAKLLIKWGLTPHHMTGHSIGEYVAACLADVFSLEDALKLVICRGKLMQQMPTGSMLSVKLPEEQVRDLMNSHHEVELAAVNGPSLCVVCGPHQAVDEFTTCLQESGYRYQRLHTSHAFHSQSMDPILEEFKEKVGTITIKTNEPAIPYISNVTGKFITARELSDPGYWATHLRRTVRFSDGLTQLLEEPDAVFIEVGPGRTLNTFVQTHSLRKPEHQMVNLIRHPREKVADIHYLLGKIGQLWIYGKEIDWAGFHAGGEYYRMPLPTYPFARQRHWKLMDQYYKILKKDNRQSERVRQIEGISDWFYVPSWKQRTLPPIITGIGETGEDPLWMIFMDEYGLGVRLGERLEKQDHRVIRVNKGATFEKQGDWQYIMNPRQPGDYRALFKEVAQEKPGRIVHLWGVTGEEAGNADFGYGYFYQFLWLVQAMKKENIDSIQLTVVSDNMQSVTGQEQLQPHKAVLLAPVKVIPQEYPQTRCRSIDILLPEPGSLQEQKLVELLTAECTASLTDTIVAFRGGQRWVQDYESVKIEEGIKEQLSLKLKNKGVWLIIGGLGGIGLAVARQLAASRQARLVLTGRSEFPREDQWQGWLNSHDDSDATCRKIRQLQEIKTMGTEVLVCQADAANYEQMQQVIEQAEHRFGKLNGVVHAAGVLDDSTLALIPFMNQKQCEQQFRAKIEGVQVLEKVLQGQEPEICLLTSSLSSILGGLGFMAYAAGNIFMDVFVHCHNRTSSQQWISVNLDAWKTSSTPQSQGSTGDTGGARQREIQPGEGVEALMRIMAWKTGQNLNQVAVSTSDLQILINQWINLQALEDEGQKTGDLGEGEPVPCQERPGISTPYVEPESQLEQQLTALWQDFFGLDRVGIHDNFFDLGATSLDMVQLSVKLKKVIGKEVPVVILFQYPTIASLARHLGGQDNPDKPSKEEQEQKRTQEMQKGRRAMQSRLKLIKEG